MLKTPALDAWYIVGMLGFLVATYSNPPNLFIHQILWLCYAGGACLWDFYLRFVRKSSLKEFRAKKEKAKA